MKQAKIALTAVAVLAAIGGALAYKASIGSVTLFYKTATAANCTVPTVFANFTTDPQGTSVLATLNSISAPGVCTGVTLRAID